MTNPILRIKTEAGKPVVLDGQSKVIKVTISEGANNHVFQFSHMADGVLFTKEGAKVILSRDTEAEVRGYLDARAGRAPRTDGVLEVQYGPVRVTFDGDTVTIKRTGTFTAHKGEKMIAVSQISSVQFRESGFTAGYIQFVFSGSSESKDGLLDTVIDENTVVFKGKEVESDFRQMRDAIMKRVTELKSGAPKVAATAPSAIDELEKLASLRERGFVTDEEFSAKKKQLLGL